ncbi:uncharacterized protein PITG_20434 [Phytophthora infestans T30-4]|uniref:Uncharacterized protein n=1 Tax=Phytophthora infestans (strain T30-4) TaxID=403677 RepID=D0P250_PHYIT|nr:uncharacterized protein PITG_20434 [Phytophthora infestans T30-4]EEY55477.1 hypothetical protein PITG_20434 [Phytophthora infestans T30-4]|eukprot:XP_002895622.1 hypothetical protein PITG_20434 [Phytophthora infestans T30-4]
MGPRDSTAFDTLLSSITAKSQLSNNSSPVTKCVCSTTSSGQLTGSDELAGTSTVQALIKNRQVVVNEPEMPIKIRAEVEVYRRVQHHDVVIVGDLVFPLGS